MTLNIKMGVPYFSGLKTLIHKLLCVKIIFIQNQSKLQCSRRNKENICAALTEPRTTSILKMITHRNIILSELWPYVLVFFQWNWRYFMLH